MLIIFVPLCWTSSSSSCLSSSGLPSARPSISGVASPVLSRGKGSSCLTCWQRCSQCSPKLSPSLWEGHVSDSCSACPPGPPRHFLQSCFSAWKLLKMHLCGCGFGKRGLIKIQPFAVDFSPEISK